MPLMGAAAKCLDSIFIPRAGSDEERKQIIKQIGDRQKLIEDQGELNSLVIYPEGTTSNGTCILPFKKGAFMAETSYKPVVLKYSPNSSFSTSFDCIGLFPLIFMTLSSCFMRGTVLDLPVFQPNEYLFQKHADKGTERWEIIAWALRDIMSEAGHLVKNDLRIREKRFYDRYMSHDPLYDTPFREKSEINSHKALSRQQSNLSQLSKISGLNQLDIDDEK